MLLLFLTNFKWSRFDKAVILSLLAMALAIAFMVWRGDRVGARVVAISPAAGAADVSSQSDIRITFDQMMAVPNAGLPLEINPPVSGTISWDGPTLIFSPITPLKPDTTYTVSLTEHLASQNERAVLTPPAWQFQTRPARLIYVAPDTNNVDQLFVVNPFNDEILPVQLTHETVGVFDYDITVDGATVAYSALRNDGGSDLKAITMSDDQPSMLLECPEAICYGVSWTPDGQRLTYERRAILVAGTAPGPPRLWWLSVDTGETVIIFDDSQIIGYGAKWSPDGQWLSYVAPGSQGVQAYNVVDGRSFVIPSRMGSVAVWSPNSEALLVTDVQRSNDGGFAVHLLRARPESGELIDISGEGEAIEDTSPVWSPDGQWLALTRKTAGESMGKQVWLMRPDGSEARSLTDEPEAHHAFPAWSPDGRHLVYQRFPLKELNVQPAIWLMNIETGEARELIVPGNRPLWLP
jgi:TolB protein